MCLWIPGYSETEPKAGSVGCFNKLIQSGSMKVLISLMGGEGAFKEHN